MPISKLRFIKRYADKQPIVNIKLVPKNTRGFYTLLFKDQVVYVGMAAARKAGVRSRLISHSKNKKKKGQWTHFSVYEVHDNISQEEIKELEGLFRHIYRRNIGTNELNKQRRFGKLNSARINALVKWKPDPSK